MNSTSILQVVFYRTDAGSEPVREWLKSLDKLERKIMGADIKTVQFGWPLGMPLVRKVDKGLWEVRSHLDRKTARVFFTAHDGMLVLLHGFVKKTQKTPTSDLMLAKKRMAALGGRNE